MRIHSFFFSLLLLSISCLASIYAQPSAGPASGKSLEQQYDESISLALRFQVRSDSLSRLANQKRRDLAFLNDISEKRKLEGVVLSLEHESFNVQKVADSLYSIARVTELRIISAQRENGGNLSSPAFEPSQRSVPAPGNQDIPAGSSFLLLGGENISSSLSPENLAIARSLEQPFDRANRLMDEVSEINDEIEQLGHFLNTNPRRIERRRTNRRIEALTELSFSKKMEAMIVYKDVNFLRYNASAAYLESKRKQLRDSLIIKSGLVHEEMAHEGFRNAMNLRETAVDLRSDKYLEGFTLRAYTEELKALGDMEKALDVYNTPPSRLQQTQNQIPLRPDGRIDTGLALSRTRSASRESLAANTPATMIIETGNEGQPVEFGFSVFNVSPYSNNNPIPVNSVLPGGLVYTIQLGVFNMMMTPASFGGLYPVIAEKENGNSTIRYYTGVFATAADAEKALVEVNRQGFSDAFLVSFNDGSKIPVTRARQMERSRQPVNVATTSQEARITVSAPTVEEAGTVVFKLQLGAFRELLQPEVHRAWHGMINGKNLEHTINNNGLYVYTLGNFNTFDDALQGRDFVRRQGIPDAFVVPFKGSTRIGMDEANELMRR